jgi:hypothetical protein
MSKFKRENQLDMVQLLVAGCDAANQDQNLSVAGPLLGAGTAAGVADGQLGVLSWDFEGTVGLGTFIPAGTTATDVAAIKIIQGTPASANTTRADIWQAEDQAWRESGIIHSDMIRSVAVKKCQPGKWGNVSFTDFDTSCIGTCHTEYYVGINLDSIRNDRDYGKTGGPTVNEVFETPNYTALGTVDPLDHLLQNMLLKVNTRSRLAYLGTPTYRGGNEDVLALAINTGGGTGTAIGTITCGDSIPFMNDYFQGCDDCGDPASAQVSSFIADEEFIRSIACVVDAHANAANVTDKITATSTIEVIDLTTAGNAANVNAFIVFGLPSQLPPRATQGAESDIMGRQTRVNATLGRGFDTTDGFNSSCCLPQEATGLGEDWLIANNLRVQGNIHTLQSLPSTWYQFGQNYINRDAYYTSYIIDYYDYEETMTLREQTPKQLIMLFACAWTCPTVNDVVTNIGNSDPDVATVTTACDLAGTTPSANTVPDVQAVLDAWIESARSSANRISILADATPGTPYLT